MREDELTNPSLDSVFGEGPQVDLGDITDLIKDASIVDLSWLSEPISFKHSNSIEPANSELEYTWGDTTDSLYGAFKLVKGNPPIREQIKKKSLWDHSEETADNLYKYAPNSVSRVASSGSPTNSHKFLRRLMHRGYTGENLNLEARKYMPQEEWKKAASNRNLLASEEGLLGNVYVDVTAFDSCHKAKEVTDKYNKLAKFVLKTSACGGCSFNNFGRCALVSKKIATKQEIFTDNNTQQYLDYLFSVKRVDDSFLSKHASLANKEKLQQAFLARKEVKQRVAGVKAKLPLAQNKKSFNEDSYVKVAAKYLQKGYSVEELKVKFAEKVPHNYLDQVFTKAASSLSAVPTDVARCDSELLKNASSLSRTAKCQGCVYDMSSHCGVSKTAFSQERKSAPRQISAAFAELPMVSVMSEDLINKTAKALKNGNSYNRVLKAASKISGTNQAKKALDLAILQVKTASPDQFDSCDNSSFALVSSIKVGNRCGGCSYNAGAGCSLLKKAFVQEAIFDKESLKDNHLYGSFYKDLTLDRMVSVDNPKSIETIEVEGLNQFNL